MFSVIIPIYNAEHVIGRCIKSVLGQTYQNFEIIAVDDGSQDGSVEAVSTIHDSRIRLISQNNCGVAVARNTGIQNAKYQWICFLDADDEWLPMHLEVLANMIEQYHGEQMYSTAHFIQHINGNREFSATNFPELNRIVCITDIFSILAHGSGKALIRPDTVCIDRKMFDLYGGFEPGVKIGEDTDMWYRIVARHNLIYNPIGTTIYHREDSTATRYPNFNFEWPFEKRCITYMMDNSIAPGKRESIKNFYNISIMSKARQYLLRDQRKEAFHTLKLLRMPINQQRYLLITLISFLLPQKILSRLVAKKNRGYFAE